MPIDIILIAMVAGFIILRLRNVLGSRPDEEEGSAPVIMPGKRPAPVEAEAADDRANDTVVPLEADPALRKAFRKIRAADPYFEADEFLTGARTAYGMILEGFWKGDRATLKNLVSDDVYGDFVAAIEAREEQNLSVENRIIDLASAEIDEAEVDQSIIRITVRFESDIVAVTRTAEGAVVEGNMTDTVSVTDLWTFERNANNEDPTWLLTGTESA